MRINGRRRVACLATLAVCSVINCLTARELRAQDSVRADTVRDRSSKNCWRGKPRPFCDQFLITEIGAYRRLLRPSTTITVPKTGIGQPDTYSYNKEPNRAFVSIEVGGMKNLSDRSAIGATAVFSWLGAEGGAGVKARYRRWLSPNGIALDIGAGVESRPYEVYLGKEESPGFTSDIAINAADYLSVVARYDLLRINGRTKPELSLGVRAGSIPAAFTVAGIATTFSVLLTIIVLSGGVD